jgi:hypothetical protein
MEEIIVRKLFVFNHHFRFLIAFTDKTHTHKIVVECRVALFVVGGSKFTKLLEIGEDDVGMFMFGEKSIDF